jgi:peptide/nickel transport system ATP-binding protein
MTTPAPTTVPAAGPIVTMRDVTVEFRRGGGLVRQQSMLRAVDGVSLEIAHGEALALVGESGCGKTTLARVLLGMQRPTTGDVTLDHRPLTSLARREIAHIAQPVFQDPYSSLNPRQTVASIIALPLIVEAKATGSERRRRVGEIMERVGLSRRLANAYPSQLSGGQRQRVAIARALVALPRLVVCDEPTSALDVSVQAQILNLLQDLRREFDLAYLFISHNLSVVHHIADRVAVMYLGRVVETGPVKQIFDSPAHPYTRMLLSAALTPDPDRPLPAFDGDGSLADPTAPPDGCHFHPRCSRSMAQCRVTRPAMRTIDGSEVACHLYPSAARAETETAHKIP